MNMALLYFQMNKIRGTFFFMGASLEGSKREPVRWGGGGRQELVFNYAYMRETVVDVSPCWMRLKPLLFSAFSTSWVA